MNKIFLSAMLLLALSTASTASSPVTISSEPDYTGRLAMMVDGKRVGRLERQPGGLYLLRYPQGDADKCSINEVILMPETK
jgi:hypothetical protein